MGWPRGALLLPNHRYRRHGRHRRRHLNSEEFEALASTVNTTHDPCSRWRSGARLRASPWRALYHRPRGCGEGVRLGRDSKGSLMVTLPVGSPPLPPPPLRSLESTVHPRSPNPKKGGKTPHWSRERDSDSAVAPSVSLSPCRRSTGYRSQGHQTGQAPRCSKMPWTIRAKADEVEHLAPVSSDVTRSHPHDYFVLRNRRRQTKMLVSGGRSTQPMSG